MTKTELNNAVFPSIIAEPIWDKEVQYFFDGEDLGCMNSRGLDLGDYTQVKDLSAKIYYYVYYQIMPKFKPKWNQDKLFSFRNWITHDCPKNKAELDAFKQKQVSIAEDTSLRHRKNINDVQGEEKETLIKAFKGIMDLPNDHPNSFYTLGGIHWYPGNTYCEHHVQPFLAWHRAYLIQFENALRSIPGCENVTLPYWDISDDHYPEIFSEAPFNTYKVPTEFLVQYPDEAGNDPKPFTADGTIKRYKPATYNNSKWGKFRDATHDSKNPHKIDLDKLVHFPSWNAFNGLDTSGNYLGTLESLMNAHDTVHVINGLTTLSQDVTGFEPVFWLFHANWDRMMWQWQQLHNATTVEGFKQNVKAAGDNTDWIDGVGLNIMDPFTETLGLTLDQTIDLNSLGINYFGLALPLTKPEIFAPAEMSLHRRVNKGQSNKNEFAMSNMSHVSLRVKDVDRLKIPGAFTVSLYLGGELLQTKVFFQATKPGDCANCVKQAFVSFDFEFENERLQKADGKVKVEIQLSRENADGNRPVISFKEIGNPTINIRLIH
jgi:tyrosinase